MGSIPTTRSTSHEENRLKSRPTVHELFNKRADELNRGIVGIDYKITLADYLRNWLKNSEQTLTSSALHGYENHVNLHIIPLMGHLRLCDLRPSHIEEVKIKWLN